MTFAASVWAFAAVQANLVAAQRRANDLHGIHGLAAASPLIVSPTQRAAGAIEQSISEAAGTVTVTRLP